MDDGEFGNERGRQSEGGEEGEEFQITMKRGSLDNNDMEDWNGLFSEEESVDGVEQAGPGTSVTPNSVLRLKAYTEDYLCAPEDNIYNINFSRFKIRDLQTGAVILDLHKQCPTEIKDAVDTNAGRFIQYRFSPTFLALREIGATLEFTVGAKALNKLRLIERHYYREHLLKSFDFEVGFCIPFSRNTCEHIYTLPELDPQTVEEMIASPFETKSDSFYFGNNKLIMHHKAEYAFCGDERHQH
uniref:Unc-119 lipid binding chaperone c n=1 Tax=Paramormyrops kingsleyae TaxID=1676925 RepID=A0A3B3Q1U8_9TELE|nr:protein unc-119 homolog B-like isoform X1 [Paramormyrops kingsleyae]